MEIIKGTLAINERCDYRIYGGGKCTNLRELFDEQSLNNKVEIKIVHKGEVLFNKMGILSKQKIYDEGQVYMYFVDEENLDNVLWDLVDKRIELYFTDFEGIKLEISKEENKEYPNVVKELLQEIKINERVGI